MRDTAPRGVVFDLFRTLVSPEANFPRAYLRTKRMAEGLGLDLKPFDRWWRETQNERIRARVPTVAERIRDYCSSHGSVRSEEAIDLALFHADQYHDEAILNPPAGVLRTLNELRRRHIRVGILSNTDEHEIRMWAGSPLSRLADAVALSVDTGWAKPEPEAFQSILHLLGDLPPSRTMYVGDGGSDELAGARVLGFRPVVFMRGFVSGNGFHSSTNLTRFEREADVTVDDLPDVLRFSDGKPSRPIQRPGG
jgi:putative hydrolase of the HAD superfamily